MIEEALNFGMNATQLSKMSNLQSQILDLDKSLQDILDNKQKQISVIEEQNERQELEHQRQKTIIELRNSIFNLKTDMEDTHQSNKLSIENKYLQFRNTCQSPAIQLINPDYFDTFEDKEYAISAKRYLLNTKDELYDGLNDGKKSIVKNLDAKEKSLKKLVNSEMRQPILPSSPSLDESKMIHKGTRPLKPNNYYKVPEKIKNKDIAFKKEMEAKGGLEFGGSSDFSSIFGDLGIIRGIAIVCFSLILVYILNNIFPDPKNNFLKFLVMSPVVLLSFRWFLFAYQTDKQYRMRKFFYEYDDLLDKYFKDEKLKKDHGLKLQYYKDNYESIMQNYQNELDKYEANQENIAFCEKEIITLHQSLL